RLAASPWLNLGVSVLFLAFALNPLGVYEIRLPTRLMTRLARPPGGHGSVAALLREAIRMNLLGRRIRKPKPLASSRLARLEGGTFSSDELKGKIAVVNFWGLWCAPCVEEIPQVERLYRRYSADPVLLDDGYSRGRVNGWPTTWFVDREGRIAYRVEGATVGMVNDDAIVQQMVWRVESLRDTDGAKARKP
ncbi:MAG TPA: redoxin domain-containing protein, partial [Longimicrobiales bacterium]